MFTRVQQQLQRNGRNNNRENRNRHGALLRGLLYCRACNRAMSHTFTTRGNRRYRYYTCTNATKRGRRACPGRSLPAAEIERTVVDQIRHLGQDTGLISETLAQARQQTEAAMKRLSGERSEFEQFLARTHAEIRRTATEGARATATAPRIAELNDRVGEVERSIAEIDVKLTTLRKELVSEAEVSSALADFDGLWNTLSPREQARMLHLLIGRIEHDPSDSAIELAFFPTGIKSLANDVPGESMEDAA